jgi:hypothetical protein
LRWGIDGCMDDTGPSSIIENKRLMKLMIDAKVRNITYYKELRKIVDPMNHLDGIKGNLYLS